MNVLMTTDTVGGVWHYTLQLCRGLQRHDVTVTLATMGVPLSPAQAQAVRALPNVDVHESGFALEWMREPWNDVRAAGDWLLELEQRTRPAVVHLNGYAHGALPWSAPLLVAGHSCVLSWWRAVHGTDAPPEWNRYRDAVAAGLRAARLVVAPTRAMLDALIALYAPAGDMLVIANGCDSGNLPFGARDAFGRYARTAKPQPLVLAAGRLWDESKGMATLAAAAPAIAWPVFVAGQDTHPDGTRRPVRGAHMLGELPPAALQYWMQRASIFVQPSLYEPFGLAPLEAARARCALVLSDIPSLREVWGDAAMYVPPRSAAALADAVTALIAAPLLLEYYADAALRRARSYSTRRMARAYHEAYARLARAEPVSGTAQGNTGASGAVEELVCAS